MTEATLTKLPRALLAPEPTWTLDVDVVVLGSGAAGLSAALAVRPVRSALIVTKDNVPKDTSTLVQPTAYQDTFKKAWNVGG